MSYFEANFDGLMGPTHNYGGLSDGNLASATHAGLTSRPREGALQGLEKMAHMHSKGLKQGWLPPHQRPFLPFLRQIGFTGSDENLWEQGWAKAPQIMKNMLSASPMWCANAATVSPSVDTADGRLHLTPANLSTMLHRSVEGEQTQRALGAAFPFAAVHAPLPMQSLMADEGAANHVRLCGARGAQGVELFVYGRDGFKGQNTAFPARQTLQSVRAIALQHGLRPEHVIFAQQSETAIESGAFHNDVVCVGALQTLFYHQDAFAYTSKMQADITAAAAGLFEPIFIEVSRDDVSLKDAISSYLFNSMLVQFPQQDRLTLIAPMETKEMESTARYCEALTASQSSIGEVIYVDVRQSMRNGGGPACLRLRVALSEREWAQTKPEMKFNDQTHSALKSWAERHYREELSPSDLRDPSLIRESFTALDELTQIMTLGPRFYPFQRSGA
jgi:succinylarginine dihydrolase